MIIKGMMVKQFQKKHMVSDRWKNGLGKNLILREYIMF
jgi:hypothetical protein